MRKLASLTGATALFLGLLTLLNRQLINTLLLGTLSLTSLVTLVGLHVGDAVSVQATHYFFIYLVYFGAVFATGYALAFVATLSAVALVTRVVYGKCIFSDAYTPTGPRNTLNDLTYIVPLVVVATRCALNSAPSS